MRQTPAARSEPVPRSRREARELARAGRHRTARRPARQHPGPRHAVARHSAPRRSGFPLLLRGSVPLVAAAVVAAGVVGMPDRVSAGAPVAGEAVAGNADLWLARATPQSVGRAEGTSRSALPRFTLAQDVGAALAAQRSAAARVSALHTSLGAAVQTTQAARGQARELTRARAFHEPVLGAHQTSSFGWRWGRMHNGIDYGAGYGAPLYAVGRGVVSTATWNPGLGYHVKITLDTGELIVYGHLSEIWAATGDRVEAGTEIGAVGSSGRSTGAHLHLEVRTADGPIDPTPWLAARRGD